MQDYIPIKKDINAIPDKVFVKQYDNNSRFISLQIMDKDLGDDTPMSLTGCSVQLFVQTNDNQGVIVMGNVADGENGILSFLLPSSVTQTPGTYKCEVRITEPINSSIISTRVFDMEVEASIFNDVAYLGTPELTALQQALIENGRYASQIEELQKAERNSLGDAATAYVKPVVIGEITGYAAQGMIRYDGDRYLVSFSSSSDATESLIALVDVSDGEIVTYDEVPYGHVNSLASDGVYYYCPAADGKSIYKFTVSIVDLDNEENGGGAKMDISTYGTIDLPNGSTVYNVFDVNGIVYAFGVKNGYTCFWSALSGSGNVINISLPEYAPRVGQSVYAADGLLYWLRSCPNTIGVFDLRSGTFIRWINIGHFSNGVNMIGEIESIAASSSEGFMLLSQFYYPNPDSQAKRFYMLSELGYSQKLPAEQQHIYPNELRKIYVSNLYHDGISVITNSDGIPPSAQTGSSAHPYPSLELALYAAMATPDVPVNIIIKNTDTDYEIDPIEINSPSADVIIYCAGKVTFTNLILNAGNVAITGNAHFDRITTSHRSRLHIDGGTFTASARISDAAPYIIAGEISIVNGKYTGDSTDIMFEVNSGSTGTLCFTSGTPKVTNYQQTNVVLYGSWNAGAREKWQTLYPGGGTLAVGGTIPINTDILNNAVYRIKWRARADATYQTEVVSVSNETSVELKYMTGSSSVTCCVAHLMFSPSADTLTLIDMKEYTWAANGALTISSAAVGTALPGWSIASIDVKVS